MSVQVYKYKNVEIKVDLNNPRQVKWLEEHPEAILIGSEESKKQKSSAKDATTELKTSASSTETSQSQDNQTDTESNLETGSLESQTEKALERAKQRNKDFPLEKPFYDLNKQRYDNKQSILKASDYQFENGNWTIPSDSGEAEMVDESSKEHGEAVKILNKQRAIDLQWGNENLPAVSSRLTSIDDSYSSSEFNKIYQKYGFEIKETDSLFKDELEIIAENGDRKTFSVDSISAGNITNKKTADDMTAWMRERAIRTSGDSEDAQRDQVALTNEQISGNKLKTNEQVSAYEESKTLTQEEFDQEQAIREEEKQRLESQNLNVLSSNMMGKSVGGSKSLLLDSMLDTAVAKRYEELGVRQPSLVQSKVKDATKSSIDRAKIMVAKRAYAKKLGIKGDELDRFMKSNIDKEAMSLIEYGDVSLLSIYEGLDASNEDVSRISKSLLTNIYNNATTLKNIDTQVNALDGNWGNFFFKTSRQEELKASSKEDLLSLKNKHKVALADISLLDEAMIDMSDKQTLLAKKIDVEGSKSRIKEIQGAEYTTQEGIDKANAEITRIIKEQSDYIDEYNANSKNNKEILNARRSAYTRLNDMDLKEGQIEQYVNVLGKNHQLLTEGFTGMFNMGIDLIEGLETVASMPFQITDELIDRMDEGQLKESLKGVSTASKVISGRLDMIDWDGDPETPTARESFKKNLNEYQERLRQSVQDPIAFSDIKNSSDAGEWALTMGMSQAPQLALIALTGGTAGLVVMGAGAAGQKFDSMSEAKKLYSDTDGMAGVDHDFFTMLGVSILSGTAEALSERVTFGQIKYVKGMLAGTIIREAREAGIAGVGKYLGKNVFTRSALLRTGKDMFEEGGSEVLATMSGNILDFYSGDKKEFNLFEGGLESFVSGSLISATLKTPILFKHAIAPFQSITNQDAIASNNVRVKELTSKIYSPSEKSKMSKAELKDAEVELADILDTNKELIAADVNRVDSLDSKQKSSLIKINSKANKLKSRYSELMTPELNKAGKPLVPISKGEKQYQIDKLKKEFEKLQTEKNDILKSVPTDVALKNHRNATAMALKLENEINKAGGSISIKTVEMTTDEFTKLEIDDKAGEGATDALLAKGISRDDLNLITGSARKFGAMVPILDSKGELTGVQIIINKDTALKSGKGSTGFHELAHAVLHNTIKQDPKTRQILGGKLKNILKGSGLKFKTPAAEAEYYARISSYDANNNGEEMLVIASEMLSDGELEFNDTLLQKLKDFIRQFSQQYMKVDIKLETQDDVRNFLKDFHTSVENNKPSKALARMMTKGAKGKLVAESSAAEVNNEASFSRAVDLNLKSNPDLMQTFDQYTKNEDGSPKYETQEDFEASEDYYNAYSEIVEGNTLDGLIKQGMTAQGLPPEALKEFTAKVKEGIGLRFLPSTNKKTGEMKPGYRISNNSLFGWLTGVAGGAGKSIIYRAKGDVMVQYKKDKKADTVSLDKQVGEGGTLGDIMQAGRDQRLENLEEQNLTPGREQSATEVINELKVREVLDFPDATNESISDAIKEAGIPLDNLSYKDTKAFVNSASKITKKGKDGKVIIDKKTGKPKLFKATKTADVVPNAPLYKVLKAVSASFGIDPLRILADQDLNGTQRKAAQKLIYRMSVNSSGRFNDQLLQLLPEGETRGGEATGVANTKLGQLYKEGGRAKFAEGATAAGKKTQTKRNDVTKEEFLGLFGIKPDGALDAGTKNDGAIRALVVQMAQLEANQEMRTQAFESGSVTDAVIAKLAEGKGEIVFSQAAIIQVANSDLSTDSIERIVENLYPDMPRKHKGIVKSLMKDIGGFAEIDAALNGEFENITGKDLQQVLIEKFEERQYQQGIKAMLESVLPLKENGSPVDPGNRALDINGVKKQRSHLVNQTSEIIKIYGAKKGLEIIIGHLAPTYSSATQIGDKRFTVDYPGGKVIDNPDYNQFKLNEDGTFVLDKDGKKTKEQNRQQVTTGQPDFIKLISQAGIEVVKIDKSVDKNMTGFTYKAMIDGSWVPLQTTLLAEDSQAFIKESKSPDAAENFDARKAQADDARALSKLMLDNAWTRYKSEDSFDAADFGLLAMSLGSSMTAPLRRSANAEFIQDGIEDVIARGKAKGLPMKKILRYEHMKSKEAVISEIIASYMDTGVLNPKVWEGYQVQIISEAHDKLIDAAGYKTKSPLDGSPRAYNEKTLAAAIPIYEDIIQDLGIIRSMDPSKKGQDNEVIGKNWLNLLNTLKDEGNRSIGSVVQGAGRVRSRINWSQSAPTKGMSAFDFDETLIIDGDNFIIATSPDGKEIKIKSDQWPIQGPALAQEGYNFDFSDFVNVRGGVDGPLLQKMKNQVEKYGASNVFVLTARMQEAATPIHEWLKSKGINIPLKNITGLGKSEGSAKAEWMLGKFAEGYNDMYFVDDALPNVKAVSDAMSQLDIKSKIQLVKQNNIETKSIEYSKSKKLEWKTDEAGNIKTTFDVAGKKYNFNLDARDSKGSFDVEFNLGGRIDVTGTGNSVIVFRTVYDGLVDLISKNKKIKKIEFSALKGELSRVKLYTTLMDRLGKKLGWETDIWEVTSILDGGRFDFELVKPVKSKTAAVEKVLDQLDIKSKVVQAKIQFSQDASKEFNDMLERSKGIKSDRLFGDQEAKVVGSKKGRFNFFVPPTAEDFKGLTYAFLGKGKQGDADAKWFKDNLFTPYAKSMRELNTVKQRMAEDYKALRKKYPKVIKSLNNTVPGTKFTVDNAIRVYLWNKAGFDIPGITDSDVGKLINYVNADTDTAAFAESLGIVSRRPDGYIKPSNYWVAETVGSDLTDIANSVNRSEFLTEWQDNIDKVFSSENMNKIEAIYGPNFKYALENMLTRMKTGSNIPTGRDGDTNNFLQWINGSVGAVMFFNSRSALLQTLSTVNFIDFQDNNIFKAAKAFANQPQYWKDFSMLYNSDMLKQRRSGLKIDVSASELTNAMARSNGKATAAIAYLLELGFTPTQIADSFAISMGGATYYRNRVNKYIKEGKSKKDAESQAFLDFQEIAEETQQSSRPDLISQQQAGVLGRLILAWANTPMQMTRLTKKALSDLVNNRGDWKSNISRILYYGAVQNLIFGSLQTALAFTMFGFDDEDDEQILKNEVKEIRVLNGALDTILRGTGVYGAVAATVKNTIMKWNEERNKPYGRKDLSNITQEIVSVSPPLGSKLRKIMSAIKTYEYNEEVIDKMNHGVDNPAWSIVGNLVEATTNIPLARLISKMDNIDEALRGDHEMWKRAAMILGWNKWSLGVQDADVVDAKAEVKEDRAEASKQKQEEKKLQKEKEKLEKEKLEQERKKAEGIKTVRCSASKSNGQRCSMTIETKADSAKCVYHKAFKDGSDTDGDGKKEYKCTARTSSGSACKNKTENTNKKCYAHQ